MAAERYKSNTHKDQKSEKAGKHILQLKPWALKLGMLNSKGFDFYNCVAFDEELTP